MKNVDILDNDMFSSVSKDDDLDCENELFFVKEFSIFYLLIVESLKIFVVELIVEDELKFV